MMSHTHSLFSTDLQRRCSHTLVWSLAFTLVVVATPAPVLGFFQHGLSRCIADSGNQRVRAMCARTPRNALLSARAAAANAKRPAHDGDKGTRVQSASAIKPNARPKPDAAFEAASKADKKAVIARQRSQAHEYNVSATAENIVTRASSKSGVQREFNNEISRLGKAGQWQDALGMLEEMHVKGFPPTAVSYNAVLTTLTRCGQSENALEMFDRVFGSAGDERAQKKMKPDSYSYSAVLSACAQMRQWERAMTLFDKMLEAGIEANVYHYSSLIAACERGQQPARAFEVFEQMQSKGIKPNAHTYVHRFQTQRKRQYKKYTKKRFDRPLEGMHAVRPYRQASLGSETPAGSGEVDAGGTNTIDSHHEWIPVLKPPGLDIPPGFSYIVPNSEGRTPADGRTATPPSILAMQELSLSQPVFSLKSFTSEYRWLWGFAETAQAGPPAEQEVETAERESAEAQATERGSDKSNRADGDRERAPNN